MKQVDLVVTRHKGLCEYLIHQGLITSDTPIIEHATPEDVTGRHVLGVLPHWLSSKAASVTEVPLNVPAEKRGVELTLDDMMLFAGDAKTYVVQEVQSERGPSGASGGM